MPDHSRRYGRRHRRLRAAWAPRVAAGLVDCARCGQPIQAGQAWDLGHVDGGGPADYQGPEHVRCNRATGRPADPQPRPRTRW